MTRGWCVAITIAYRVTPEGLEPITRSRGWSPLLTSFTYAPVVVWWHIWVLMRMLDRLQRQMGYTAVSLLYRPIVPRVPLRESGEIRQPQRLAPQPSHAAEAPAQPQLGTVTLVTAHWLAGSDFPAKAGALARLPP